MNNKFKIRARIIDQLGEQLIKNNSVALLELIKNSYDADATKCEITMTDIDKPDIGYIKIEDNGTGMTSEIIKNVWLEIGTSFKKEKKEEVKKYTEKYHRIPLGEKGIGRFGVHKLGRKICLITSADGLYETVVNIDWDDLEKAKYIEDIPIDIKERKSEYFKNETGTKIIITKLKKAWTRGELRNCARNINSLNSPFENNSSFSVSLNITNSEWLERIIKFSDIDKYKLFSFDVTIHGNEIKEFIYKFEPWLILDKLSPYTKVIKNIKMQTKDLQIIDFEQFKIGTVKFKGIIFDRESSLLKLEVDDIKGFKEYMNRNSGIKVFRDNMRVLDYGEPGNDWLGLDIRRINRPTYNISNNIIIAGVFLNSENSTDLIEKADREGFIENEAFDELKKGLNFALGRIESLRQKDKEALREFYGSKKSSEPIVSNLNEIKELINSKKTEIKMETKKTLLNYVNKIECSYEEITDSLIRSAGAGLNFIIAMHQIEKLIKTIIAGIKYRIPYEELEIYAKNLLEMVEGYSVLVQKTELKARKIGDLINKYKNFIEYRLRNQEIELILNFNNNENETIICTESHLLNIIINIIDNSIYWLNYSKKLNPKYNNSQIYLSVFSEEDKINIILADNGPGFSLPTDLIIKPFITDKQEGTGIGLYLSDQLMKALNGKLFFPEFNDYLIPKEFKNGALLGLKFNKGGKL